MKFFRIILAAIFLAPLNVPAATWINLGLMNSFRQQHTATLLPNGKVLVAGGDRDGNASTTAEIFDPATGSWTNTGAMLVRRTAHTATLLPNGKVLVAGGYNFDSAYSGLASAELYDPATGLWTYTGPMRTNHFVHSATLLPNGTVLVAGNWNNGQPEANAEIYDPATDTWTLTGSMTIQRAGHTATLLPNGKVLLIGGSSWSDSYLATTDIYDPATGTWSAGNSMNTARISHTANLLPDGRVLVAGGNSYGTVYSSLELYDSATGLWTTNLNSLTTARTGHAATLLPNGKVLLTGGLSNGTTLNSAELYDPATGSCTPTASLNTARTAPSATLLPDGRILVAGGNNQLTLRETELYDPQEGNWTQTGGLNTARYSHTATLLTNGLVLVAGGAGTNNEFFTSTELYNPVTGTWSTSGILTNTRTQFAATLMPDGRVLVAGGFEVHGVFSRTDIYDPVSGNWSPSGALNIGRYGHTVTLLPDGRVLASGGSENGYGASVTAEVFDPATGTWTFTGSMATNREDHCAVLLPNGKVLVAGGQNQTGGTHSLASAELYDPGSGKWTAAGSMPNAHGGMFTATLLPDGKVLVAGGYNSANGYLAKSELYDSLTGTWTATGNLNTGRVDHQATLLPNGKVMVTGGAGFSGSLASVELYDPVTGVWTETAPLATNLYVHTATLIADGRVLVVGGSTDGINPLPDARLYEPSPGVNPAWQPQITSIVSPLFTGGSLTLAGSGFRGLAEGTDGSGGDTARNFPLAQLRSLVNGQSRFLTGTNWSADSYRSGSVYDFPPGPALVTVYVNGLRSRSGFLVKQRLPAAITLSNLSYVYNGNPHQPASGTAPAGRAVYFTYNGSNNPVTNAGNYTVVARVNDLDYAGKTTNTFAITPATATLTLGSLVQTYTGTGLPASVVTVPAGLSVTFTYNGSSSAPTNPGSYTVIGTIVDPNAFPVSATNILTINKASATVTLFGLSQTYTGTARTVSAATVPFELPVHFTYNGSPDAPTNAGAYTVIGTVVSPYYQGAKTNILFVAKAAATVTLSNLSAVYDGTGHGATATTAPPGLTLNLTYNQSTHPPTNAASYTVNGTVSDTNYFGTSSATFVIQKAPATITFGNLYQLESGPPENVTVSTAPPGLTVNVTYNGSATLPVAYGDYTVIGTVSAQNYSGGGTNLLQIFPAIRLRAALSNGTFALTFTNKPGSVFTVLATTDATRPASNWPSLGSAVETASGQFQFINLQAATNTQYFYRVRSP